MSVARSAPNIDWEPPSWSQDFAISGSESGSPGSYTNAQMPPQLLEILAILTRTEKTKSPGFKMMVLSRYLELSDRPTSKTITKTCLLSVATLRTTFSDTQIKKTNRFRLFFHFMFPVDSFGRLYPGHVVWERAVMWSTAGQAAPIWKCSLGGQKEFIWRLHCTNGHILQHLQGFAVIWWAFLQPGTLRGNE